MNSRVGGRIALSALLVTLLPGSAAAQANIWNLQGLGSGANIAYSISHTKNGVEQTGEFQITTNSNGGQLMATVEASLGDNSCSSTTPLQNTQAVQMQIMMSCMMFAPIVMTMFAPTWAMLAMTSWELGSQMNMNQTGQQFSFQVTEECSHAGITGVLAELDAEDTSWDTCVKKDLPFPLSIRMSNDGEIIAATLTQYDSGG